MISSSSMTDSNKDLGRLIGAHGISPIFIQRAVAISVISFLFFVGMMFGFYIRQNIGYFLLATAFLIVYLITMFSWVMQRRTELRVFENGFSFKKRSMRWADIKHVGSDGMIDAADGTHLTIPQSIRNREIVLKIIRDRAGLPE
jgi:magnesium-transporting ATPase (P-type)